MKYACYSKTGSSELLERQSKVELDGLSRMSIKSVGSLNKSKGPSARMIENIKRAKRTDGDYFSIDAFELSFSYD